MARTKARRLGLELDITEVRPRGLGLAFTGVSLGFEGVPEMRAKLEHVDIGLTFGLTLERLRVEGGAITFDGALESLPQKLKDWRKRHHSQSVSATPGSAGAAAIEIRGLAMTLRDGRADTESLTVSGIRLHESQHHGEAGFDTAQLSSGLGSVTLSDGSLQAAAGPNGWAIESGHLASALGRFSISSSSSASKPSLDPESDGDPDEKGHDAGGGPAPSHTPQALAARLAPWAQTNWEKHAPALATVRQTLRLELADGAKLDCDQVRLELTHGSSVLNIGPAPMSFVRESGVATLSFRSNSDRKGNQLALNARVPLDSGPFAIDLAGGPVSLRTLGVRERDFGLLGVDATELSAQTHLTLSSEGKLDVDASGRLDGLSLWQPAIAPDALEDVHVTWGGRLRADFPHAQLALEDATLSVGRTRVEASGSLELSGNDARLGFALDIPITSCQDLLESAPEGLLPKLDQLRLGGTFSLHSRVAYDTHDIDATEVEWNFRNRCKVLRVPEEVDPKRFREPFQHSVIDAEGNVVEFPTGPTTDQWVSYSQITPNMATALVVCEDSHFFKHDGFDTKAIGDSLLRDLKTGEFSRGGSTISMQLAKNLYLGREKTISRKLEEAVFTLLLEQSLTKEEILELYLNVVEFGPDVYGIRNAATHYFNTQPAHLSLAQAMFLASSLRNPKTQYFAKDGTLKTVWAQRLRRFMHIARKIHRIDDEQLQAGLSEQLVFGQPSAEAMPVPKLIFDGNDG